MTQSPWQPISPAKPVRSPKQPLTRERIVDAAMRVLVDQGYDAVSMRKVAQELGTGPASLYAHVANKRELDQLLVDRAAQQMDLGEEPDPARWQEQLKDAMRELLRVLRANPGVARAAIGQVPLGEQAMLSTERFLGILRPAVSRTRRRRGRST
jgi:AcrR family transcriptional regulator